MPVRKGFYKAVLGLFIPIAALAQGPIPQPVQWKASLPSGAALRPGIKATIDLSGEVQPGWHVYALTQPSGGPIPLRIALDENSVAQSNGKITGTDPIRKHDASFELDTQLYEGAFTLHVPVEVKHPPTGNQLIPLSVRFQACSDRTCLPPRTIHLSVPVEIASGI